MRGLLLALRQTPIWTSLHPSLRHIVLTLAIHVREDGTTQMSMESLMRHTGLSAGTINKGLRRLERAGVIARQHRKGHPPIVTFTVAAPARTGVQR